MRRMRLNTLALLMTLVTLAFIGALALSAAMPDSKKKPPTFPQSLFAQAKPDDYLTDDMCADCHKSAHASAGNSPHALYMQNPKNPIDKRGCQACHGPGGIHVNHLLKEDKPYENVISYTKAKPEEINAACLRCHTDTLTMAHWQKTGHARANISCTTCHQLHSSDRLGQDRAKEPTAEDKKAGRGVSRRDARSPVFPAAPEPKALLKADEPTLCGQCHKREVSEFKKSFHHPVPEGKMVCSDCHDTHPNRDNRKRFQTGKQNCITCHGKTAGPFVFEHDPVNNLSSEGCVQCHRPHGSHNPKMLVTFSRGLCNQCHSDKANNHYPGGSCWQAGCHSSVHGSNHEQFFFTP